MQNKASEAINEPARFQRAAALAPQGKRSAQEIEMGNLKYKTEGGHKRGHSNMEHWAYTEEIKDSTRKRRRAESKEIIRNEMNVPSDFDGEACIRLLRDKTQDPGERESAADSLMWYPKPHACQAMLDVILDDSEGSDLREGVATCLGSLWSEMDYDEKELQGIPEPYKSEVLREMKMKQDAEPSAG